MKIEYITDWETIYSDDFQKQWLEWVEKAENSHVFFHPALCMAWLETYRPLRNLEPYFAIGKDEGNVIFLPLVLWKRNWKNAFQKLLIPVGYSDFDYHDPISVKKCTNQISVFLTKLQNDSFLGNVYDKFELNGIRFFDSFISLIKENEVAPYAELFEFKSIDEANKLLPNKLKGDIRRQIRRLEELGNLQFENIYTINDALKILPDFLQHHQNRWPNSYKAPKFHENLIKYGLENGLVDFSILELNSEIISYHLGFKNEKCYYYYMPAINFDFSKYSPGKIHLYFLFESAFKNRIDIFDHLRGDENYKSGWTNKIQELYYLETYSSSFQTRIKSKLVQLKSKL